MNKAYDVYMCRMPVSAFDLAEEMRCKPKTASSNQEKIADMLAKMAVTEDYRRYHDMRDDCLSRNLKWSQAKYFDRNKKPSWLEGLVKWFTS